VATTLDCQRMSSNDPAIIKNLICTVQKTIQKYNISPTNMWNMDEKRILLGKGKGTKVVCRRGRKNPRLCIDGNRELITVVESINAAGSYIAPFIIFKDKSHMRG